MALLRGIAGYKIDLTRYTRECQGIGEMARNRYINGRWPGMAGIEKTLSSRNWELKYLYRNSRE
jgi:hypothetical protein